MKRAAVVLALFVVGVLAGFQLATPAPALCLVAVDLTEGAVYAYTAAACPSDPNEPFRYSQWSTRTPVCMKWAVVTTASGPKVIHPCKE